LKKNEIKIQMPNQPNKFDNLFKSAIIGTLKSPPNPYSEQGGAGKGAESHKEKIAVLQYLAT